MRGQRMEAKAPYGHWKTMTFLAALRHDRIGAPWVIDGPINGELFRLCGKGRHPHAAAGQADGILFAATEDRVAPFSISTPPRG